MPDDLARRQGVMRGPFAEIRDEVLPPAPDDVWRQNLGRVARALGVPDG